MGGSAADLVIEIKHMVGQQLFDVSFGLALIILILELCIVGVLNLRLEQFLRHTMASIIFMKQKQ